MDIALWDAEAGSLGIIAVCLLVSAFFSSTETALNSLGTLKARHLLESKPRRAAPLQLWLDQPGRVITTVLLFNTAVIILAAAVTTDIASRYFGDSAISVATGITTFLVLVFGEIIPKSFAKAHAEATALIAMRIVAVIYYATYPLIWAFSGLAEFVIRQLSQGRKKTPLITEEEIEFIVSEGERAGVIEDLKKEIIEGAFDFDETKVREIMTPRTNLTALSVEAPFAEIVERTIETGHSRIPIYRDNIDHIVGLVLAKDLLAYATSLKDTSTLAAKDLMRDALFAPESKTIMEVFKDLKRTKSHMAVIIDEYGGTAGIVTMEDILEEIVGEIQDEFDAEQAKVLKIDDNIYEVSGAINIEEFFEYFHIREKELPEEMQDLDVDTLAGLITQLVGQMPKIGQKVDIGSLKIEVLEVVNRRIDIVKVECESRLDSGLIMDEAYKQVEKNA